MKFIQTTHQQSSRKRSRNLFCLIAGALLVQAFAFAALPATKKPAPSRTSGSVSTNGAPANGQSKMNGEESTKAAAKISPEAQAVLNQIRDAYSKLETAQLDGQIRATIDTGDQKQEMQQAFTSSYKAPNKFRHDFGDDLVVGSTGEKTYVFQRKANAFVLVNSPKERALVRDLPRVVPELLQTQNPSLLFAICKDPVQSLTQNMKAITTLADVKVGSKSYTALKMVPAEGDAKLIMLIDPETHLIRRLNVNVKPEDADLGETKVQNVTSEVDYTTVKSQADFKEDHFTWTPPQDAKDLAAMHEKTSAQSLENSAAPNFTLQTLDGSSVSLSDLKGQVVVLDFWATWCPPCVKSLPQLGQLHQELSGKGVKVFAVNLKEDNEKVNSFLKSKEIQVPVLLDKEGEVAEKYNVRAIPETVVIGKDGHVKKVFIGTDEKTHEQIRQQIESAKQEEP